MAQYPALAAQMTDGAKAALSAAGVSAVVLDAPCDPVMAAPVAAEAAALNPLAIIGLPCGEALEAFAAVFAGTGTPLITVGSRAPLRDRNAVILRIGPREAAEADALSALLLPLWTAKPFAILDDGSVHARSLSEGLRNAAELAGVQPVLVEEFRPGEISHAATLRRLRQSGALAAFVAGDGEDVTRITAEAQASGFTFTLAGTESMLQGAPGTLWPEGTLAIVRSEARGLDADARLKAARKEPFAEAEGYTADGFAAAEVALALAANPAASTFETVLGTQSLADDGFLEPSGFALFEMRGGVFSPVSQQD